MDAREARIALREARRWAAEGLVPPESLAAIEARYAADAAREPEGDGRSAALLLYGVGGALLGAAAIALVLFLEVEASLVAPSFLAFTVAFAVAGVAVDRLLRNAGFADALLVAALVAAGATAVAGAGESLPVYPAIAVAFSAALLVAWRARRLVPAVAAVAFYPSAFAMVASAQLESRATALAYAALAFGFLAFALGVGRALRAPWRPEVLALAAVGAATGAIALESEVLKLDFAGAPEILVGLVELAILAAGLALRERGLALGAAVVIAVDAIVFAFDVGGLLLGLGVLVATAIAVLSQAELIRRYLRD